MPTSASARPEPDVVARLRAAGCVFAEDEAALLIAEAGTADELDAMVERRVAGLPLEHVLGWAEFCGLRIALEPGVFVPRYRTEFMAEQAAALAPPRAVVVDLCCGSGAVGVAVIAGLDGAELHAGDLDPAAVRCAHRNVDPVGGRVYEGDLYEALPTALRGRVDVLTCNAPYVPTDEIRLLPPEARLHEPHLALDGGADGLDILRRVTAGAPRWLAPGASLLFEASQRQAPGAVEAVRSHGLVPRLATSDEHDATVVIATLPADRPGNG